MSPQNSQMSDQEMQQSVNEMFPVFDKNGDGRLDKHEFGLMLAEIGCPMSGRELDEAVSKKRKVYLMI